MTYEEAGFRAVYHRFVVFRMEDLKDLAQDFPGAAKSNCVLTYCCIKPGTGALQFRILAAGTEKDGHHTFVRGGPHEENALLASEADGLDFVILQEDGNLRVAYLMELLQAEKTNVDVDIGPTRQLTELDAWRDPYYPDEIVAELRQKGKEPEKENVTVCYMEGDIIWCVLMDAPLQDFPCHILQVLPFRLAPGADGKVMCVCEFNPVTQLTAQDLEDGSMLKQALKEFNDAKTQDNFVHVLQLLRDSIVLIPFKRESGKPTLENNYGRYFLPVFSSEEEMPYLNDDEILVKKPFLEAVQMAMEPQDREVSGISVNPITGGVDIPPDLYDVFEALPSLLQ